MGCCLPVKNKIHSSLTEQQSGTFYSSSGKQDLPDRRVEKIVLKKLFELLSSYLN